MIGLCLGDEPEQPYEDLIRQRLAVRRRIADCTTDRARLEYQRSRRRDADPTARLQDITARIDALSQGEIVLRAREAQLTLRIRAREP
ncbi:MAG: hypothetical protein ACRDG4_06120 [Chloroflexota bacterium]